MLRMAVGYSDDIDIESALETVFEECDAALDGAQPRAGIIFGAWDMDHQALVDAVRGHYPGIEIAGATTAGEMSSGRCRPEGQGRPGDLFPNRPARRRLRAPASLKARPGWAGPRAGWTRSAARRAPRSAGH